MAWKCCLDTQVQASCWGGKRVEETVKSFFNPCRKGWQIFKRFIYSVKDTRCFYRRGGGEKKWDSKSFFFYRYFFFLFFFILLLGGMNGELWKGAGAAGYVGYIFLLSLFFNFIFVIRRDKGGTVKGCRCIRGVWEFFFSLSRTSSFSFVHWS